MQSQCTPDIETLDRLCRLVNRESFAVYEQRNSCIFTSATLRDVLEVLGIQAALMRVETVGIGKQGPIILGSRGDGSRRRAAKPGMWHGHLTVIAAGRFLMDPTLDQIDGLSPFVGEVTDEWLQEEKTLWWLDGVRSSTYPGHDIRVVRYHSFPGQGGWKGAGDFRSVSRRRPVINAVLSAWKG